MPISTNFRSPSGGIRLSSLIALTEQKKERKRRIKEQKDIREAESRIGAGKVIGGVVGAGAGFLAGGPAGIVPGAKIGAGVGGGVAATTGNEFAQPKAGNLFLGAGLDVAGIVAGRMIEAENMKKFQAGEEAVRGTTVGLPNLLPESRPAMSILEQQRLEDANFTPLDLQGGFESPDFDTLGQAGPGDSLQDVADAGGFGFSGPGQQRTIDFPGATRDELLDLAKDDIETLRYYLYDENGKKVLDTGTRNAIQETQMYKDALAVGDKNREAISKAQLKADEALRLEPPSPIDHIKLGQEEAKAVTDAELGRLRIKAAKKALQPKSEEVDTLTYSQQVQTGVRLDKYRQQVDEITKLIELPPELQQRAAQEAGVNYLDDNAMNDWRLKLKADRTYWKMRHTVERIRAVEGETPSGFLPPRYQDMTEDMMNYINGLIERGLTEEEMELELIVYAERLFRVEQSGISIGRNNILQGVFNAATR